MSRFYASVSNDRSQITKAGHKDGLTAHIRGWNKGVRVEARIDNNGHDEFRVYKTTGSNKSGNDTLLAIVPSAE